MSTEYDSMYQAFASEEEEQKLDFTPVHLDFTNEVKEKKKLSFFGEDWHIGCVVGPQNSGKSTLLEKLLRHKDIFYKKYQVYISITPYPVKGITAKPPFNLKTFDITNLSERLDKLADSIQDKKKVLILCDDAITDLYESRYSRQLLEFFSNIRHKWEGKLDVSLIIVSQGWKAIPTNVRRQCDWIIAFPLVGEELEQIKSDFYKHNKSLAVRISHHLVRHNFIVINKRDGYVFLNLESAYPIFDKSLFKL